MRGSKSKLAQRRAADAPHGSQLLTIVRVLRAQLAARGQELARSRNPHTRAKLAREIEQLRDLVALREAELKDALDRAEAERVM